MVETVFRNLDRTLQLKTSIQFINHASVIVSNGKASVLSDPWYAGNAFHKGWNLLYENSPEEIIKILDDVTHIWISHEHPDHFSILFFKSYAQKIKEQSIKILFQKTRDKRVFKFLSAQGFDIQELEFNRPISIAEDYKVTCIKDGFYDSGLMIESNGEKILNLNDCDVTTEKRGNEVYAVTGNVDVLLTQFSFAAWKGGKQNKRWRDEAASEKINTIRLQIGIFKPKIVIPFASFAYFSNHENFYLNDAVNEPKDVAAKLGNDTYNLLIMAPFDKLGTDDNLSANESAIAFWDKRFREVEPVNRYETIDVNTLAKSFHQYCKRIHINNNVTLIKILRVVSPISVFQPCTVHLDDLDRTIKFDYISKDFKETNDVALLSMPSACLNLIFTNSFGFDTLTINGCFEEATKHGFVNVTKSLAIENLNNLGIKIQLKTMFNFSMIKLFLSRLNRVGRKLNA